MRVNRAGEVIALTELPPKRAQTSCLLFSLNALGLADCAHSGRELSHGMSKSQSSLAGWQVTRKGLIEFYDVDRESPQVLK